MHLLAEWGGQLAPPAVPSRRQPGRTCLLRAAALQSALQAALNGHSSQREALWPAETGASSCSSGYRPVGRPCAGRTAIVGA